MVRKKERKRKALLGILPGLWTLAVQRATVSQLETRES